MFEKKKSLKPKLQANRQPNPVTQLTTHQSQQAKET